jgi:hypothetical protein
MLPLGGTLHRKKHKGEEICCKESSAAANSNTAATTHSAQQTSDLVELRNATKKVMHKTYELFEAEFLEKKNRKLYFSKFESFRTIWFP